MNNNIIQMLDAIKAQALKIVIKAENLKSESDLLHIWNCLDVEKEQLDILVVGLEDLIEDAQTSEANADNATLLYNKPSPALLYCNHCQKEVKASISKRSFKNGQGFHLRADCTECGKFIKFVSQ